MSASKADVAAAAKALDSAEATANSRHKANQMPATGKPPTNPDGPSR